MSAEDGEGLVPFEEEKGAPTKNPMPLLSTKLGTGSRSSNPEMMERGDG